MIDTHLGIGRRLPQELHDDVERLERVMDDQVLRADRGKAVAVELADAFRESARCTGLNSSDPAARSMMSWLVSAKPKMPSTLTGSCSFDVHVIGDEGAQILRHRGFELQPDDAAATAPLQRAFEPAHQIFGFFGDLDVAVAQHAEASAADDLVAREQPVQELADDLLERR